MTGFLRYASTVGWMLLGAAPLSAQSTARQAADPVIRVTVDLVQLDAVVTDSEGRHVTNLKPEEFQILEDGKLQKITHFSYIPGPPAAGGGVRVAPGARETRGESVEAIPTPAKAVRPEQVQRTIVMIADDLSLSSDDVPNVRKAMKSFVEGHLQAGDLVSIMTTSGGTGVMQQLTNDARQLLASIDRIRYVPGRTGLTWYEPTNIGDKARRIQTESNARLNAIRAPATVVDTLGTVAYAIQGLREMPGRKAIALFSGGFAQSAAGIVELANRASVVLYTFDPRGLASFFLTAVDVCTTCAGAAGPRKIRTAEREREAVYRASQSSLEQMARETGGLFFHDDNNLEQGLATALDDMSGYYLMGYRPQRPDFEQVRGLAQFHKIQVKVLRPNLRVRSRNGFAGTPDPPAAQADGARKSGKDELRRALLSPFQANGFPVLLSAFYSASKEKDPKTGRRSTLLRAMLAIDAHGVVFGAAPDGRKELTLEVAAAAYGANNELVVRSDKIFSAAMTADEMNQLVGSGLVYNLEIEIPKPGSYQLRVAARDANSERIGSATSFVEIPDFSRAGMSLSSVQLYDSDSKRNEELTRAGVLGGGSPVTRVFLPGAVLRYDCTVYGALIDKQTGKPKIDVAVHLFEGADEIFASQPKPLEIAEASKTAVHATGDVALPGSLPPGEYTFQLVAYDRVEKKRLEGVTRWVDFTLVK